MLRCILDTSSLRVKTKLGTSMLLYMMLSSGCLSSKSLSSQQLGRIPMDMPAVSELTRGDPQGRREDQLYGIVRVPRPELGPMGANVFFSPAKSDRRKSHDDPTF